MLTKSERATIMDACQSISRSADALKDCHTVDGDWGDELDAKAFYDAELNLLARLTALLTAPQPPAQAAKRVDAKARMDWAESILKNLPETEPTYSIIKLL
ncbi:hypothetical protein LGN12_30795, partial [Burkholderia multivorans]|nr:hypothetical protein [Burkholderia multivorans]